MTSALEKHPNNLWHPWTPHSAVATAPTMVSGEGSWVTDSSGRRYLDAKGCALNASVGYSNPEVVAAMQRQAMTLMTYDLAGASTPPAEELAAQIADLTNQMLSRVFFCSSGSEATETAIKMTRLFHLLQGQPQRRTIIGLSDGYHGTTLGAMSTTRMVNNVSGNDPLPPDFVTTRAYLAPTFRETDPAMQAAAAERAIADLALVLDQVGSEHVAAVILEPILGIGGVRIPPLGYLAAVHEICHRAGILLIADEVMTGVGRTGSWFAYEHEAFIPDVMLLSKCLSGGYFPLSAVAAREHIYEAFADDALLGGFRHGFTSSGHATGCAAALAVLDIITRDSLVAAAHLRGIRMLNRLAEILAPVDSVEDVRGRGLLLAVQFEDEAEAARVREQCWSAGLIVRLQGSVISIAPPLNISDSEESLITDTLIDASTIRTPDLLG